MQFGTHHCRETEPTELTPWSPRLRVKEGFRRAARTQQQEKGDCTEPTTTEKELRHWSTLPGGVGGGEGGRGGGKNPPNNNYDNFTTQCACAGTPCRTKRTCFSRLPKPLAALFLGTGKGGSHVWRAVHVTHAGIWGGVGGSLQLTSPCLRLAGTP